RPAGPRRPSHAGPAALMRRDRDSDVRRPLADAAAPAVAGGDSLMKSRAVVVPCLHPKAARLRPPTGGARAPMVIPALTLALLCLAVSGCLFTGKINTKPQVQIVVPPGSFGRGQSVPVSAMTYDAEGGPIRLEWSVATGDCPPAP